MILSQASLPPPSFFYYEKFKTYRKDDKTIQCLRLRKHLDLLFTFLISAVPIYLHFIG